MEQETKHKTCTCKIYKGIDSPCKIKGLLYKYFYMMLVVYGFGGLMILLEFSSVKSGNYGTFFLNSMIICGIVLAIRKYFTKMSNKKKIRPSNKRVYLSTRSIFKSLKS